VELDRIPRITGGTGAYIGVGGVLAFARNGHVLVLRLTR
jgi:hypothetical protein